MSKFHSENKLSIINKFFLLFILFLLFTNEKVVVQIYIKHSAHCLVQNRPSNTD